MTFSIQISNKAKKQRELLNKICKHCKFDGEEMVSILGVYQEEKRVHDVWRYNVTVKNYKIVKFCKFYQGVGRFFDQTIDTKNRSIVLIIESPHKDEYDNKFAPIAPAQGATGEKIEKYIVDLLRNHKQVRLSDGLYNILIVNPVQFQASLFNLHKVSLSSKNSAVSAIRDKVWLSIFSKEKDNFVDRLISYKPSLLINACTAKLKSIVDTEIKYLLRNKQLNCGGYFIADKHPSVWSSKTKLTKAKMLPGKRA